jgi:hypothetical protein
MIKTFQSISETDEYLKAFILATLNNNLEIGFNPPPAKFTTPLINVYLFKIKKSTLPDMTRNPSLLAHLQYLLTVHNDDYKTAHLQLDSLLFACMKNKDFELSFDPIDEPLWRSFGIAPCPFLLLCAQVKHEQIFPDVQLVRKPLLARHTFLIKIDGIVTNKQAKPLQGAHIDLPEAGLSSTTDSEGKFSFPSSPGDFTQDKVKDAIKIKVDNKVRSISINELIKTADGFHLQIQCMEV